MHSFFLAETCKYLYLLFNDTMLRGRNYVFTTEGHLFPVGAPAFPGATEGDVDEAEGNGQPPRREQWLWGLPQGRGLNALDAMVCPDADALVSLVSSTCHGRDTMVDSR